MQLVENQIFFPLTTNTIQMVPGRTGYEPAAQTAGSGNTERHTAAMEARDRAPMELEAPADTTYNRNRRITASQASEVGSYIDTYG